MTKWGLIFFCFLIFGACTRTKTGPVISELDSLSQTTAEIYKTINEKIKKEPDNASLFLERALISMQQKDLATALKDLNRTVYIDSNKADAYYYRGDIYFKQNQSREAREDLLKAVSLDPKHEKAYLKLAEIELILEKYSEAIRYCNEVLKINVYSPVAYFMKGMSYKYAGDTVNAISSFQTAIEQDDQFYDGYLQLGRLFTQKDEALALDYYNNAIKVRPNSIEAIYHKCMFLQEHGQFNKALEGYDLMLSIDSTNRNANYNKGYLYLVFSQQPQKAQPWFERVLKYYPDDIDATYNLGLCYEKQKQIKQAAIWYKKALSLKPDYELAAKALSRIKG